MSELDTAALRVLVVEDDESIREILKTVLCYAGYQVSTARDGEGALQIVAASAADGGLGLEPDVILLDMDMPVMNGWEFARAYRRLTGAHAPIIAVTAAYGTDQADQALEPIETDDVLYKPVRVRELLEAVGRFAGRDGYPPVPATRRRPARVA